MKKMQLFIGVSACAGALNLGAAAAVAETTNNIDEVVVTATRSEQVLTKVPISVAAFTRDEMEQKGVKQLSDLVRLTPGLVLNSNAFGGNDVAIRGIRSTAGAATTGIYIDDVPIQVRNLGVSATTYPAVFDLDRVEVLRGPQGTLFGSGSEGGTVRFIQPAPSLTDFSGTARLEGSKIPSGGSGYEAGVAVGGPLVEDKVGFRVSAYYRKDAGWIDKVPGTYTVLDPRGQSFEKSLAFTPTGEGEKNFNDVKTMAFRGALKLQPTESFSITPSVFYQQQKIGSGNEEVWFSLSDFGKNRYVIPDFSPAPADGQKFTAMSLPDTERGRTDLALASLNMAWDLDGVSLFSNSSYLRQKKTQYYDYTSGYERAYMVQGVARPGAKGVAQNVSLQNSYVQEFRIQSNNNDRIKWVLGGFYQLSEQSEKMFIEVNTWVYNKDWFGIGNLDNQSPFGPGFTSTENIWGAPVIDSPSGNYRHRNATRERQVAGFGQIDFKFTDQLTLVAGARFSRNWLHYEQQLFGPENNLSAPFGAPCPTGPVCPFNNGGPFAPAYPGGQVKTAENAFTPKIALNFQKDENNLFYASASKGYRPGGGQVPLPLICNSDLVAYGYTDASGKGKTPTTFGSDSVWSYEAGAKNKLFGGRVQVASSAYVIKWKNIQTVFLLPECGYTFIDNLSSATVKGFDLDIDVRPMDGLTVSASVGYNDLSLDKALLSPTGGTILAKGAPVPFSGAPWRAVLSGRYDWALTADMDAYLRGDITYNGATPRTGSQRPDVFNYDPRLQPAKANTVLNMRTGIIRGDTNVSLFVDNVFNTNPYTSYLHATARSPIWRGTTLQPRKVGITASHDF